MELALVIILSIVLVAILLLSYFRTKFTNVPSPRLVDYFLGDMYKIHADSRELVRSLMRLHKKHGPVFQVWMGLADTLVTAVPADVVQVLSSSAFDRNAAEKTVLGTVTDGSLFTMTPEVHRRARKHIRENFNYSLLDVYHEDIRYATEVLCESLRGVAKRSKESLESVDISLMTGSTTFGVISSTAFGTRLEEKERQELYDISDHLIYEMLKDFFGYPVKHALTMFGTRRRFLDAKKKMEDRCQKYIETRLNETKEQKESRPVDLLDALVGIDKQDVASLMGNTALFALAGAHTTSETLNWSIYETCCSPEITKKIHAELDELFGNKPLTETLSRSDVERLKYTKHVWNETLRCHPPGPVFVREATKDVKLQGSGIVVPKGKTVMALLQGAHMSSKNWEKPHEYQPERWEQFESGKKRLPAGAFVPFSAGPRNCAGMFFANYEGLLILAELHRRFEFTLACRPEEIYSCSGWVEAAKRKATTKGGADSGIPVYIRCRKA